MRRSFGAALAAGMLLTSGCYFNQSVQPNQVGVVFKELSGYSAQLIEKLLTAKSG